MVGAAGFPCGIFPDVKILRAGPRGFCLARNVPFFCAQTKTSLRPSPHDAGKAVCLLRRPNKKGTAVKQFLLVNGRGGGIRTHDLTVPNRARYHLRYAP